MNAYTAHIVPRDGIARRFALVSLDRGDAIAEARLLGRAMFRGSFVFSVRAQ